MIGIHVEVTPAITREQAAIQETTPSHEQSSGLRELGALLLPGFRAAAEDTQLVSEGPTVRLEPTSALIF